VYSVRRQAEEPEDSNREEALELMKLVIAD
jgi:hypothetical protein